jgi:hypothetical protein
MVKKNSIGGGKVLVTGILGSTNQTLDTRVYLV